MSKKFRVLVTGANTAIGRSLAHELYRDQASIEYVFATGTDEQTYYFRDYHRDRFGYRVVNLNKPRQQKELFMSDFFKRARIDTVVHLAFLTAPDLNGEHFDVAV